MKKLLSILTISTLTASTPAPLLANTTITRIKNDVGATAKDITNGFNIKTSIRRTNQRNKIKGVNINEKNIKYTRGS